MRPGVVCGGSANHSFADPRDDPTILDVVYKVTSDKATVDVRVLAFEDGERSFWKVVRPETFVKDADGNETAQNVGDGIAANAEHTLSWKVSSDWKTDLAKVKFEILTREDGVLPLDLITIPSVNGDPEITCSYNAQTDADVMNAMYWYYADGADDLALDNGYLKTASGEELVNRANLGNKPACVRYVAEKMGYLALTGTLLDFARTATLGSASADGWVVYYADVAVAGETPVGVAAGVAETLDAGTCNRIRTNLAKTLAADADAQTALAAAKSIEVTGPDGSIALVAELGIAPAFGGVDAAGVAHVTYAMPSVRIMSFDPATGRLGIKVEPGAGNAIVDELATGYVHVYGTARLGEAMRCISQVGFDLTPYLKAETKGEATLRIALGAHAFFKVKIELASKEEEEQ